MRLRAPQQLRQISSFLSSACCSVFAPALVTPDVRRQVLSTRLTVADRSLEPRRRYGTGLRHSRTRVCDTGQDQHSQAAGKRQNATARFKAIGSRTDLLLWHEGAPES